MAQSLATIKINFSRAIHQADELESLSKKLKSLSESDMESALQSLNHAWTGEAAEQYLQKGRQLENKINKNAAQLQDVSRALRNAAQAIYNAEMKAWEIAHVQN